MKRVNFIFFAVYLVFGRANGSNPSFRVVGGTDAIEGQFPYQVLIQDKLSLDGGSEPTFFCSGTIIGSRFILSTAHCIDDRIVEPETLIAIAGVSNRVKGSVFIRLDKIVMHEDFVQQIFLNDIMLIRTAEEIVFSLAIQKIKLPTHNDTGNTKALFSGWGRTNFLDGQKPYHLQFAGTKTITTAQCIAIYKKSPYYAYVTYIRDSVICTKNPMNVGACVGDSGGPLVDTTNDQDRVLIGIISWAIPCAEGLPDVHTRVYSYLEWIEKKIEELSSE